MEGVGSSGGEIISDSSCVVHPSIVIAEGGFCESLREHRTDW